MTKVPEFNTARKFDDNFNKFYLILLKVMRHNKYGNNARVEECTKIEKWTPVDLILREYLNNGGGSARGFLGISKNQCVWAYDFACKHKSWFLTCGFVNEKAWNNSGAPLWHNYNYDR